MPAHPNLRPRPPFAPGQNSQTGKVHRRGPDRKPRQIARTGLIRALVAAKVREGQPVSGFEDMFLGLREHLIRHARYFVIRRAESYLTSNLFWQILGRIERLAWHPR